MFPVCLCGFPPGVSLAGTLARASLLLGPVTAEFRCKLEWRSGIVENWWRDFLHFLYRFNVCACSSVCVCVSAHFYMTFNVSVLLGQLLKNVWFLPQNASISLFLNHTCNKSDDNHWAPSDAHKYFFFLKWNTPHLQSFFWFIFTPPSIHPSLLSCADFPCGQAPSSLRVRRHQSAAPRVRLLPLQSHGRTGTHTRSENSPH